MKPCTFLLIVAAICGSIASLTNTVKAQNSPTNAIIRVPRPIRNEYIVVLRDDVPIWAIDRIAGNLSSANRGVILNTYRYALKGFAVRLPEAAAVALSRSPYVAYVEENGEISLTQVNCASVQNPYSYWALDRMDQRFTPRDGSYCYNRTGRGVNAYVVDTGIWFAHQDFGGRASFGTDTTGGDGLDCYGHGTNAASIIGGASSGIAKEVRLYAVRTIDCNGGSAGGVDGVIAGIDWITRNHIKPAVVNVSIAFNDPRPLLDTAIRNSINAGVVYVIGAGNLNTDVSNNSPARVSEAITVGGSNISDYAPGATNVMEYRWSSSNYGSLVDVFAPAFGVYSAVTGYHSGSNSNYSEFGGTSASAPFVAGVAAMYLEHDPYATPFQVQQAIVDNATFGLLGNIGPGSPNLLLYSGFVPPPPGNNFQFSSSSYTVNEGDGSIQITVTRTGSLFNPASVDYAVSNGTASERADIITSAGTLRFAAGEVSKTFTVLITDDSHIEGSETLNLALRMPTGGDLGSQFTATLTINDNDFSSAPNPIDSAEYFVRQQYRDFLNRDADPSGLAYWTNQITSCGGDAACIDAARVNTSQAFFLSIEFQQTGYLVHRFNRVAFNQMPRFVDFMPDTQDIGRGVVVGAPGWEAQLEANKQRLANEFIQRPAFKTRYLQMTNDQYVDALFANAGVTPGAEVRSNLINGLSTGAQTRATVLRAVAEDATFSQREYNPAFVLMQYFGYLRRNPDDPPDNNWLGYEFWLNEINGGVATSNMVRAFIVSQEYRSRFGG